MLVVIPSLDVKPGYAQCVQVYAWTDPDGGCPGAVVHEGQLPKGPCSLVLEQHPLAILGGLESLKDAALNHIQIVRCLPFPAQPFACFIQDPLLSHQCSQLFLSPIQATLGLCAFQCSRCRFKFPARPEVRFTHYKFASMF